MVYHHHCSYTIDCTLQELTSALASDEDPPPDSTLLTKSLTSLSDKGLILFVHNHEHPLSSWVVVEKEALLREVNGILFAPNNFKQYRQVASNTGIVLIATLEELFPQYSSMTRVVLLLSSNNHLEVVKYLIREGHCNLSCKNNDGDTPLHIACRCDHLNIAQYLISEAHCDPSCKNNNGDTPLHLACNHRHACSHCAVLSIHW